MSVGRQERLVRFKIPGRRNPTLPYGRLRLKWRKLDDLGLRSATVESELIDRIYESSFVPELWPGILDELGRIAETPGGSLFITKAEVQYWTSAREDWCTKAGSGAGRSLLARLPCAMPDF